MQIQIKTKYKYKAKYKAERNGWWEKWDSGHIDIGGADAAYERGLCLAHGEITNKQIIHGAICSTDRRCVVIDLCVKFQEKISVLKDQREIQYA